MTEPAKLVERVTAGVAVREPLLAEPYEGAVRLFNGYSEGAPGVLVELFGTTAVVTCQEQAGVLSSDARSALTSALSARLPFVTAVLWKRRGGSEAERHGELTFGEARDLTRRIRENGVRYALELTLHQDASFYLDTRELRSWLKTELAGKTLLNTFAYTGSLGVAAAAGGAREVVHLDKNRAYLNVAKASYALNGLPVARRDFIVGDFFATSSLLRKQERLFDCVVLDPPFFSSTSAGRVDLLEHAGRLLNKARPLVADGGALVFVNNALFVSGADFQGVLEQASSDGYIAVERFISVPDDVVGMLPGPGSSLPADPSPFNHPTKIAVLRVRRKDGRKASAELA